ncbi:unnamed protein product, partial [Meganyctiphanes norvegica]
STTSAMGDTDSTALTTLGLANTAVVGPKREEVLELLAVTHGIILPILITWGVLINGFCLVVVDRPVLNKWHFNKYVKLLALVDMLGCLASAPAVICQRICYFSNYTVAFYYTHFGWTLVLLFRSYSVITILWMSYDRVLAIWNFQMFQRATKPEAFRRRLMFTILFGIIATLPCMAGGRVEETECTECDDDFDDDIDLWISKEAPSIHGQDLWFKVYLLLILIGHSVSLFILLALSVGLVVGLIKKRYENRPSAKKRRQFHHTITVLIINATYAFFNIPYMLVIIRLQGLPEEKVHCTYTIRIERLAAIGTCFLMLWHSANTLIIFIVNKDYRNEVKVVLSMIPCLRRYCIVYRDERSNSSLDTNTTAEFTLRHSMPVTTFPVLGASSMPLRAQSVIS